ncbi:hypothetical protein DPMN_106012 [Dreissena polymorpha]|uniref:PHD-type domain-containing protein n=1 Tax=Dreissena polymorpha TaxID=45954 RepID=A0A9D4K479_DREPO|nr:hypothetical protein DPMN_106012 [Dreissena polymorpha]
MNHVLPALLSDENKPPQQYNTETPVKKPVCNQSDNCFVKSKACRALMPMATVSNIQTCKPPSKRQRQSVPKQPVYVCGVCDFDVVEVLLTEAEQSVNCVRCDVWIHYWCAGVTNKTLENVDEWVCAKCK